MAGTDIYVRKSSPGSHYGEGYTVEIYDEGVYVSESHVNTKKQVQAIIDEQKARYNTNRAFQNELSLHVEYKDEEKGKKKGEATMERDLYKKAIKIGELMARHEDPSIPIKIYGETFIEPQQPAPAVGSQFPPESEVIEELKTKIVSFFSSSQVDSNNSYNEVKSWIGNVKDALTSANQQGASYNLENITDQLKSIFKDSGLPGEDILFKSASIKKSYTNLIESSKKIAFMCEGMISTFWKHISSYRGVDKLENVLNKWAVENNIDKFKTAYLDYSVSNTIDKKLKAASAQSVFEIAVEEFFAPYHIARILKKLADGNVYEQYQSLSEFMDLNLIPVLPDPQLWISENPQELSAIPSVFNAPTQDQLENIPNAVTQIFYDYCDYVTQAIVNSGEMPNYTPENTLNNAKSAFKTGILQIFKQYIDAQKQNTNSELAAIGAAGADLQKYTTVIGNFYNLIYTFLTQNLGAWIDSPEVSQNALALISQDLSGVRTPTAKSGLTTKEAITIIINENGAEEIANDTNSTAPEVKNVSEEPKKEESAESTTAETGGDKTLLDLLTD